MHPFQHESGYLHDPYAERRARSARRRVVLELTRARRLQRWADRSARLAAVLSRQARLSRARIS